ncbi:MAG: hypothetical protein ACRCXZ_01010 [Patescibacteria group bacterium]
MSKRKFGKIGYFRVTLTDQSVKTLNQNTPFLFTGTSHYHITLSYIPQENGGLRFEDFAHLERQNFRVLVTGQTINHERGIQILVVDLIDSGLAKTNGTVPHITWSKQPKVKAKLSNFVLEQLPEGTITQQFQNPIPIEVFGDFAPF